MRQGPEFEQIRQRPQFIRRQALQKSLLHRSLNGGDPVCARCHLGFARDLRRLLQNHLFGPIHHAPAPPAHPPPGQIPFEQARSPPPCHQVRRRRPSTAAASPEPAQTARPRLSNVVSCQFVPASNSVAGAVQTEPRCATPFAGVQQSRALSSRHRRSTDFTSARSVKILISNDTYSLPSAASRRCCASISRHNATLRLCSASVSAKTCPPLPSATKKIKSD